MTKISFVYLVKIHNVHNYRNYHEFGKQDCVCACVYMWCVGPEPVGPRQWPWKPRTWGTLGLPSDVTTLSVFP